MAKKRKKLKESYFSVCVYYVLSRLNKGFADVKFMLCQFMTAVKKVNFLGCAKSLLTLNFIYLKV